MEYEFHVNDVGAADAALGQFPRLNVPLAVIELKGATTDLDRDRSNGRTAVQQCWDYLNALPGCPWGIVSNFRTIRLYHREKGTLCYEEFDLQELRGPRPIRSSSTASSSAAGCCLRGSAKQPRALELLHKTTDRQKGVGDELYREYQWRRLELIEHLQSQGGQEPRRGDPHCPETAGPHHLHRLLQGPRAAAGETCWRPRGPASACTAAPRTRPGRIFLDLFAAIDKGAKGKREISAFNGGLFADDPAINALELAEEKWTNAFAGFGNYDFSEEVNVEVLGHLFERSITELEKLRVGGLFALMAGGEDAQAASGIIPLAGRRKKSAKARPAGGESPLSKMPKSASGSGSASTTRPPRSPD